MHSIKTLLLLFCAAVALLLVNPCAAHSTLSPTSMDNTTETNGHGRKLCDKGCGKGGVPGPVPAPVPAPASGGVKGPVPSPVSAPAPAPAPALAPAPAPVPAPALMSGSDVSSGSPTNSGNPTSPTVVNLTPVTSNTVNNQATTSATNVNVGPPTLNQQINILSPQANPPPSPPAPIVNVVPAPAPVMPNVNVVQAPAPAPPVVNVAPAPTPAPAPAPAPAPPTSGLNFGSLLGGLNPLTGAATMAHQAHGALLGHTGTVPSSYMQGQSGGHGHSGAISPGGGDINPSTGVKNPGGLLGPLYASNPELLAPLAMASDNIHNSNAAVSGVQHTPDGIFQA